MRRSDSRLHHFMLRTSRTAVVGRGVRQSSNAGKIPRAPMAYFLNNRMILAIMGQVVVRL